MLGPAVEHTQRIIVRHLSMQLAPEHRNTALGEVTKQVSDVSRMSRNLKLSEDLIDQRINDLHEND